jgi:hypothetical protein
MEGEDAKMGARKSSGTKAAKAPAAEKPAVEAAVANAAEPESEAAAKAAPRTKGAVKVGDEVMYTPEAGDRRSYDGPAAEGQVEAAVPAKVTAIYENGVALTVFSPTRTYNKVACAGKEGTPGCFTTK